MVLLPSLVSCLPKLHAFIVRPTPALRRDPIDYLVGIGDIACLAMDAVREIHFELAASGLRIRFHLVDLGRTESLTWISVLFRTFGRADLGVEHV